MSTSFGCVVLTVDSVIIFQRQISCNISNWKGFQHSPLDPTPRWSSSARGCHTQPCGKSQGWWQPSHTPRGSLGCAPTPGQTCTACQQQPDINTQYGQTLINNLIKLNTCALKFSTLTIFFLQRPPSPPSSSCTAKSTISWLTSASAGQPGQVAARAPDTRARSGMVSNIF